MLTDLSHQTYLLRLVHLNTRRILCTTFSKLSKKTGFNAGLFQQPSASHFPGPNSPQRAIFPFEDTQIYFHYLNGPPDDIKNTPAAAMVAGVKCREVT